MTITRTCDCSCRNTIGFIRWAFTENELNTEEIIPMTLQTAMEDIKGISQIYIPEHHGTFAHCLRIHLAFPASTLQALESCQCCNRHQQNRHLLTWTIHGVPEYLPGHNPDELDTDSEHVSDSDSETDYGPDSP